MMLDFSPIGEYNKPKLDRAKMAKLTPAPSPRAFSMFGDADIVAHSRREVK